MILTIALSDQTAEHVKAISENIQEPPEETATKLLEQGLVHLLFCADERRQSPDQEKT